MSDFKPGGFKYCLKFVCSGAFAPTIPRLKLRRKSGVGFTGFYMRIEETPGTVVQYLGAELKL